MTESYTPNGSHSSGATSAVVPAKPLGATPTMVKSRRLMRTVRPTNDGSNPLCAQAAYSATATGTSAPGRSSSGVKARPAARLTPIALKKFDDTISTNDRRITSPAARPVMVNV
jgi:hypothetical protein